MCCTHQGKILLKCNHYRLSLKISSKKAKVLADFLVFRAVYSEKDKSKCDSRMILFTTSVHCSVRIRLTGPLLFTVGTNSSFTVYYMPLYCTNSVYHTAVLSCRVRDSHNYNSNPRVLFCIDPPTHPVHTLNAPSTPPSRNCPCCPPSPRSVARYVCTFCAAVLLFDRPKRSSRCRFCFSNCTFTLDPTASPPVPARSLFSFPPAWPFPTPSTLLSSPKGQPVPRGRPKGW